MEGSSPEPESPSSLKTALAEFCGCAIPVLPQPPRLFMLNVMFTVRVEGEFAAAHFLSHYHGKCENLHGHNYRVRLWARGAELDEGGMLADFGVLKQALRTVIAELDHTNLNDKPVFENDPSAERIARYIFSGVETELSRTKEGASAVPLLYAVDVYETSVNMARYTRDGDPCLS